MVCRVALLLLLASACGASPAGSSTTVPPAGAPPSNAGEPAAATAPSVPDQGPGLAVGQVALPFTLVDQLGEPRALDGWLGKGLVAIVFFRSADW